MKPLTLIESGPIFSRHSPIVIRYALRFGILPSLMRNNFF